MHHPSSHYTLRGLIEDLGMVEARDSALLESTVEHTIPSVGKRHQAHREPQIFPRNLFLGQVTPSLFFYRYLARFSHSFYVFGFFFLISGVR
jgi:hypothetical protein